MDPHRIAISLETSLLSKPRPSPAMVVCESDEHGGCHLERRQENRHHAAEYLRRAARVLPTSAARVTKGLSLRDATPALLRAVPGSAPARGGVTRAATIASACQELSAVGAADQR